MNKNSNPPLAIVYLIIYLCINIFLTIDIFLFHAIEHVITFATIVTIPLLITLVLYLFYKEWTLPKMYISYPFLFISLLAFIGMAVYYVYCILTHTFGANSHIVFLLGWIFIISLIIAFVKNCKITFISFVKFITSLASLLFVTLGFILFVYYFSHLGCDVCKLNMYEYVLQNYFSPKEIANFPKEIPENATNIIFKYNSSFNGGDSLILQYTSEDGENVIYEYYSED